MLGVAHFMDFIKHEGFSNMSDGGLTAVIALLLVVVIQLFIVQFLWNTVLTRVVTVTRPLPTLGYTLGLMVLTTMLYPGPV
jgi:hypothetical protein